MQVDCFRTNVFKCCRMYQKSVELRKVFAATEIASTLNAGYFKTTSGDASFLRRCYARKYGQNRGSDDWFHLYFPRNSYRDGKSFSTGFIKPRILPDTCFKGSPLILFLACSPEHDSNLGKIRAIRISCCLRHRNGIYRSAASMFPERLFGIPGSISDPTNSKRCRRQVRLLKKALLAARPMRLQIA